MDREELKEFLDDKINDVFIEYWNKLDIPSGDITPLQSFYLDELEDKIVDLIMMVAEQNIEENK